MRINVKKVLPQATFVEHGQHFIFCSLGHVHFDLNSHFKKLNTSNTSLTLEEPHKPKHALSALSLAIILSLRWADKVSHQADRDWWRRTLEDFQESPGNHLQLSCGHELYNSSNTQVRAVKDRGKYYIKTAQERPLSA